MADFCVQCGQPLKVGAKFCGKCGSAVVVPDTSVPHGPAQAKSRSTAIESLPSTGRAAKLVGVVALVAIALGGGVVAVRYSQDHSPYGRVTRLQIAAARGDMNEAFRVMAEARDAKQQLDMTDPLYFALMNAQPQAAQLFKDMGGDEAEARRRLEPLEQSGLPSKWKQITLKGTTSELSVADAAYSGIITVDGLPHIVSIQFKGLFDPTVYLDKKAIPATKQIDPTDSNRFIFRSPNKIWRKRILIVGAGHKFLQDVASKDKLDLLNGGN